MLIDQDVRGTARQHGGRMFSPLKRGINGSFHHVSKSHLHRYCAEFEFRYNHRLALGHDGGERADLIVKGAEQKRLTYKQPTEAV